MSTKCTIKYGDNFHLYEECMEEDCVYLSIDDKTIRIPLEIWETIRQGTHSILELATDQTDQEIEAHVAAQVDERIASYQKGNRLAGLAGLFVFGSVESPREEQIARGLAEQKRRRAYVQSVKDFVSKNKEER